jgi:hypothetical protein
VIANLDVCNNLVASVVSDYQPGAVAALRARMITPTAR